MPALLIRRTSAQQFSANRLPRSGCCGKLCAFPAMDLLERAEFFDQLQDTLAEVTDGHGRVALVTGEAGIGKTSLVEQFAERQKNECRVLWGGCDALFTPRPLGPLYDIAQQLRGNLINLLQDEAPRAAIFSAALR